MTLSDLAAQEPTSSAVLTGGSATTASSVALLPNLEANARLNGLSDALTGGAGCTWTSGAIGSARVLPLDWESCFGAEQPDLYDVVIGSDVVYEGFAVTALAEALITHTAPGGVAHLMSAKSRFEDASVPLLVLLRARGVVEQETYTIHNSFGNTQLVLTTWTKNGERH